MQDVQSSVDIAYQDLTLDAWKSTVADLAEEHGAYQPLDDTHFAAFVEAGTTLLVTFEEIEDLRSSGRHRPLGHEFVVGEGWSHLGLFSDTQSWFRSGRIYGYFDRLIDDGFFEDFDRVIFYGKGAAGYAAAAFSVSAPGAQVLVLQPQATMDPRLTEWDPRFPDARRLNFTDRFGFAPDMVDAADAGYVIFDPYEDLDAMHSALFNRANVLRLRTPLLGENVESELDRMQILQALIRQVGAGTLNRTTFANLFRARRGDVAYERRLLHLTDAKGRLGLSHLVSRYIVKSRQGRAPYFQRRLRQLTKQAAMGVFRPFPDAAPPADATTSELEKA